MKPQMHTPAVYIIRVAGEIDDHWSGRLNGMTIATIRGDDDQIVSTLTGRLTDQAALFGVLNALYQMHFPLLFTECTSSE